MIVYESELVVFEQNKCVLSDGEYELALEENTEGVVAAAAVTAPSAEVTAAYSPKKFTWENNIESLVKPAFEAYQKLPMLKFRLVWTKERSADLVDRPLPITLKPKQHEQIVMNSVTIAAAPPPPSNVVLNTNNNEVAIVDDGGGGGNGNGVNYHFIYNNNTRQQTEACESYHCPWCSLNCIALYGLLKHLTLCHSRLTFTYVPREASGTIETVADGAVGGGGGKKHRARIDVCLNDAFDGSYTGSPHDLVSPSGFAFSRAGPVRRTVVTRILVCRPRRPRPSLAEFLEIDENELNSQRPYITGHNR